MEKHVCYYCGEEAKFQLKNGNWCCKENARSCEAIKKKVSEKSKEKWNKLKEKGIKNRKDIPENLKQKNKGLGQEGFCYYCGQEAHYQLKNRRWCCCKNYQSCPQLRKKNGESLKNKNCFGLKKWNEMRKNGKVSPWNKGITKQNDQRLKKASETLKERYAQGLIKPSFLGRKHTEESKKKCSKGGGYKPGSGRGKQGWYKGYWCDSSWELAYVIYNLEHNIKFERNKQGFEYEFENKKYKYYPDFILEDGTYVEIKGYIDKKNEIKIKSFDKKLIIIDKESIKQYVNYVVEKYGKDYIKLYNKK